MRKAFSLTEILVVVAIVGLLAALIFPVVVRAKGSARTAPCTSNLRQLHVAWSLYANENDGASAQRVENLAALSPGLWSALVCPSDPTKGASARDTERTGRKVSLTYWMPLEPFREALVEADPNAGIAYCPLHGRHVDRFDEFVPVRDTEGLVLRLRRDGSVQRADVGRWCGDPSPVGFLTGRPEWMLLSDTHCVGQWCTGLTRRCEE